MILNKFRSVPLSAKLWTFRFQLLALSLFSCNKTANVNANKAFVGMTHVAYGVGPLNLTITGDPQDSLFLVPVLFGNTSGVPGDPYDTTISRVSEIMLTQGSTVLLHGNASFVQGGRYSIFDYDSFDIKSISLLILQDNAAVRTDTNTYVRFLNFSPGTSLGLKLVNNRIDTIHYAADTIVLGPGLFVGYDPNPAAYFFSEIRIGNYNVFAFTDSSNPRKDSLVPALDSSNFFHLGSLQIDSTINYNLYLHGFLGDTISSSPDRFQLRSVPLN
jgi:hypothetical protein